MFYIIGKILYIVGRMYKIVEGTRGIVEIIWEMMYIVGESGRMHYIKEVCKVIFLIQS